MCVCVYMHVLFLFLVKYYYTLKGKVKISERKGSKEKLSLHLESLWPIFAFRLLTSYSLIFFAMTLKRAGEMAQQLSTVVLSRIQHPHGNLKLSISPIPRDRVASSNLLGTRQA